MCSSDLDLKYTGVNVEGVRTFLERYELKSVIKLIPGASMDSMHSTSTATKAVEPKALLQQVPVTDEAAKPKSAGTYTLVNDVHGLRILIDKLKHAKVLAVDTETTGLDTRTASLVGICLSFEPETGYYLALGHTEGPNLDLNDVVKALKPIFDDAHRKLYSHMVAMHDANVRIDITLLADRLRSTGDLDLIGGAPFIASLFEAVPNAAHAAYYAKIVHEKSTFRSLITAGTEILKDAYEQSAESKMLLNQAEQKIFGILDNRGAQSINAIRDVLHAAMDRMEARMRGEHTTGGVETGFVDLDGLLGGLHNSELIILAALIEGLLAKLVAEMREIGRAHV